MATKLQKNVQSVLKLNKKMHEDIVQFLKAHNGFVRTDNAERIIKRKENKTMAKEQEIKWGIYIEYGTEKEFEAARKAKFPSKKMAIYWCQNPSQNKTGYHYPTKCVMRIEEILERNPDYYTEEITEN